MIMNKYLLTTYYKDNIAKKYRLFRITKDGDEILEKESFNELAVQKYIKEHKIKKIKTEKIYL